RDRDGRLTEREFLAVAVRLGRRSSKAPTDQTADGSTAAVQGILKRFDANGDGLLSLAESPKRLAEAFYRVDLDQDGLLSPEELQRIGRAASRRQRPSK
ncbi:MAG: EF-hand domain-containing protein, partial [Planctomycetota bacterium]